MAAVPFSVVVWLSILTAANESVFPAVEITGNTFFSSSYLSAGCGKITTSDEIEALIRSIIKKYTDAGFAFCRVYPETNFSDRTPQQVVLKIEEGERITVTGYIFSTHGRTDAGPLQRIAQLKSKAFFSTRDIERAKKILLKTGAFASITERIVKHEDGYHLIFELLENNNDYLFGAGSLAEENYDFSIGLYSVNIFGTMRRVQFVYESNVTPATERRRKLFLIDFVEPVILAPVSLNASFSIATHDTAQLTEFKGKFNAPLNDYMSTSLSTGIEAVSYIADSIQSSQTNTILGIGFDLNYGAVDWSTRQSIEIDHLFRAYDRTRTMYDGAFVYKGLSLQPHYRRVDTQHFDYFDYFRVGGSESIRGYLEEEFVVSQACWVNLEYKRYPVFPLVDFAWLKPGINYYISYGFGIEAKTNIGRASLIFAWPKNSYWYDGKVHFMLEKSI